MIVYNIHKLLDYNIYMVAYSIYIIVYNICIGIDSILSVFVISL